MLNTFTLRLTRHVSQYLLPDMRALLPSESVQFFCNELDEEWHYTLLCRQNEHICSLTVSAILVWHQLRHIQSMVWSTTQEQQDVTHYSAARLYERLITPGAILYLS
ncbi:MULTISPECIES: hypothetical protein [Erwinia]|uniref:Uncharacterized protein n=1 Tax=Erwinia papayae TaxID=206499 RepID=A0ABV3MXA5_9GAMM|nr:hypothetical protein [Erwinia mallotivora]